MQDTKLRPRFDPDTTLARRLFLAEVSARYAVSGAYLFGSRARGDSRPDSDADVALLLRGPQGVFLDTKPYLADIAYDVLLETGIRIQPLPVWEAEWAHPETYSNPASFGNIKPRGHSPLNAVELTAKETRAAESAAFLLGAGDFDGACNRANYAMFDAARAALPAAGVQTGVDVPRTHGGVISAFSLHLVKPGRVAWRRSR